MSIIFKEVGVVLELVLVLWFFSRLVYLIGLVYELFGEIRFMISLVVMRE